MEAQLTQVGLPLMGLPGLTVTTGLVGRVPVGVQLLAGRYREDLLLQAGAAIEAAGVPATPVDPSSPGRAPRAGAGSTRRARQSRASCVALSSAITPLRLKPPCAGSAAARSGSRRAARPPCRGGIGGAFQRRGLAFVEGGAWRSSLNSGAGGVAVAGQRVGAGLADDRRGGRAGNWPAGARRPWKPCSYQPKYSLRPMTSRCSARRSSMRKVSRLIRQAAASSGAEGSADFGRRRQRRHEVQGCASVSAGSLPTPQRMTLARLAVAARSSPATG